MTPTSPTDPAPSYHYHSQNLAITFNPELANIIDIIWSCNDRQQSEESVQYVPHSPTPSVQEVLPPPLRVHINPPPDGKSYAPLSPSSAETLIRLSRDEFSEIAHTVAYRLTCTVE